MLGEEWGMERRRMRRCCVLGDIMEMFTSLARGRENQFD
jgi:hypothetical protein